MPTTPQQNLVTWESELRTLKARVGEINRRLDTPAEVWSNPFGEPQDHTEPQEERDPPKTRLRFSPPKGHMMKLSGTPSLVQAVIKQRNDLLERIATIERLIQAHKTGAQLPAAVVADVGKNNPDERKGFKRPTLRYRSEIKRAIAFQIIHDPNATDAQICRGLDADGNVELPANWKNKPGDRGFYDAYSHRKTRHRVEVAISRVRKDFRKQTLLK